MEYKILGSRWFINATLANLLDGPDTFACIGVVAIRTNDHEPEAPDEWKVYIGVGRGWDTKVDEQYIARRGSGMIPEEAIGFFPYLPIEQYKKEWRDEPE